LVLITVETLVKLLAFLNCCYCQNVMVGDHYTDKLICRAHRGYAERESERGSNIDDFN